METFFKNGADISADTELGVAFGWGIVCTKDGEDYYDLQGDHITEDAMLKAAVDFMEKSQVMGTNHKEMDVGKMWVYPITTEIAKSLGISTRKTGLFIMAKPDESVLKQIKDGDYSGFSIGGFISGSEVEDAG